MSEPTIYRVVDGDGVVRWMLDYDGLGEVWVDLDDIDPDKTVPFGRDPMEVMAHMPNPPEAMRLVPSTPEGGVRGEEALAFVASVVADCDGNVPASLQADVETAREICEGWSFSPSPNPQGGETEAVRLLREVQRRATSDLGRDLTNEIDVFLEEIK